MQPLKLIGLQIQLQKQKYFIIAWSKSAKKQLRQSAATLKWTVRLFWLAKINPGLWLVEILILKSWSLIGRKIKTIFSNNGNNLYSSSNFHSNQTSPSWRWSSSSHHWRHYGQCRSRCEWTWQGRLWWKYLRRQTSQFSRQWIQMRRSFGWSGLPCCSQPLDCLV